MNFQNHAGNIAIIQNTDMVLSDNSQVGCLPMIDRPSPASKLNFYTRNQKGLRKIKNPKNELENTDLNHSTFLNSRNSLKYGPGGGTNKINAESYYFKFSKL